MNAHAACDGVRGKPRRPARTLALTIHLIRHGETVWNREGRIHGQLDVPLDEAGVRQARAIAAALRTRPIGAIYSSDLGRARQTAQPLAEALGLTLRLEPALRERSFGVAAGRLRDEILREEDISAPQGLDHTFPGGESVRDVYARVAGFLERLLAAPPARELALVTHSGTVRAARAFLAGQPVERLDWGRIANGSIHTLSVPPSGEAMHETGRIRP